MAVEAENKARKHGNTSPKCLGGVQVLKSTQWGHMSILSLCLRRFFAPKVPTRTGKSSFCTVSRSFCKGIWEAKLFGTPQGIVYCSSVSLHLNFRMQTALFSNLKSSLAPKIHDTLIWGNRHFALFPGRFSKDIWETKLFGNIVWRRSGRLNLNFECQRLYFSNLKSPLAP